MSPFIIHNEDNDAASMNGRITVGGDMLKLTIDEDPSGKDPEGKWATIYIDKKQAKLLATLLHQFVNGV